MACRFFWKPYNPLRSYTYITIFWASQHRHPINTIIFFRKLFCVFVSKRLLDISIATRNPKWNYKAVYGKVWKISWTQIVWAGSCEKQLRTDFSFLKLWQTVRTPIVEAGTCDKQSGHRLLWLEAVTNSQDTDCCGWKNSLPTVRCGMGGTVEVREAIRKKKRISYGILP